MKRKLTVKVEPNTPQKLRELADQLGLLGERSPRYNTPCIGKLLDYLAQGGRLPRG